MTAYFNENDPYAAEWLRNLIDAGHIAPGIVDERSIEDVYPSDLRGFTQCHFFAGIGVWSHALRSAGWPDDRPVWTGSCPCQPFSAAGKGLGTADERHLWPAWHHLIRECRPGRVYGEQVASKDALAWWDVVHADLEDAHYACGAFDLCAAGVGAPHIRQRLYWLADADRQRRVGKRLLLRAEEAGRDAGDLLEVAGGCGARLLGDPNGQHEDARHGVRRGQGTECDGSPGLLGDAGDEGLAQRIGIPGIPGGSCGADAREAAVGAGVHAGAGLVVHPGMHDGSGWPSEADGDGPLESHRSGASFWSDADWIACRDGKRRPVESKYVALVDGAAGGMGLVCPSVGQEGEEIDAAQVNGNGRNAVRALREDQLQTACPSQGREPRERRPVELADFVRLLPSSLALAELHRDAATADCLRALLSTCGAERLVQHAPDALEAAWRSLGEEGQDRFRVAVEQGPWVRTIEHPLAHGAPSRVGRLRAYGNAIVAPLAAAFVQATMN